MVKLPSLSLCPLTQLCYFLDQWTSWPEYNEGTIQKLSILKGESCQGNEEDNPLHSRPPDDHDDGKDDEKEVEMAALPKGDTPLTWLLSQKEVTWWEKKLVSDIEIKTVAGKEGKGVPQDC